MLELKDPGLLRDRAYVDGAWIAADAGGSFPVENPANGEILANVADCGAAETRRAIEAANAAWPAWRAKSVITSYSIHYTKLYERPRSTPARCSRT